MKKNSANAYIDKYQQNTIIPYTSILKEEIEWINDNSYVLVISKMTRKD